MLEADAVLKALQSYVSIQHHLPSSARKYTNKWFVSHRLTRIIKIMHSFIAQITTHNKQMLILVASALKETNESLQ